MPDTPGRWAWSITDVAIARCRQTTAAITMAVMACWSPTRGARRLYGIGWRPTESIRRLPRLGRRPTGHIRRLSCIGRPPTEHIRRLYRGRRSPTQRDRRRTRIGRPPTGRVWRRRAPVVRRQPGSGVRPVSVACREPARGVCLGLVSEQPERVTRSARRSGRQHGRVMRWPGLHGRRHERVARWPAADMSESHAPGLVSCFRTRFTSRCLDRRFIPWLASSRFRQRRLCPPSGAITGTRRRGS